MYGFTNYFKKSVLPQLRQYTNKKTKAMESFSFQYIKPYFEQNLELLQGLEIHVKYLPCNSTQLQIKEVAIYSDKAEKEIETQIKTFWNYSINKIYEHYTVNKFKGKSFLTCGFIFDNYSFTVEKTLVIFVLMFGEHYTNNEIMAILKL